MSEDDGVPLTILTGWLGAGKSTLLRRLLLELGQNMKIAVIQNEFSELGVEQAVVRDETQGEEIEGFLELANGCVCCTVRTDFISALETLLKKRKFDHIVLECSGVADPGPLAEMFWVDQELEFGVYLDAIICLVDAKNFSHMTKKETDLIRHQIAYADRIIINKIDIADIEEVNSAIQEIELINGTAKVAQTDHCQIDLGFLLNIKAFNLESLDNIDEKHDHHNHQHGCGSIAGLSHVVLDRSCSGDTNGINLSSLQLWITELLWEQDEMSVYRMKGVFAVQNTHEKYFLQSACALFDLDTLDDKLWEGERFCRLVLIGTLTCFIILIQSKGEILMKKYCNLGLILVLHKIKS